MQIYNTGNTEKYSTKNPLKRMMVERLNGRIIDSISQMMVGGQSRVLDAGCGEGYISRLVATAFPNADITGLEYTSEAIAIAEEMSQGIHYVQGDIMEMPFSDSTFDVVICTEVLEHLDCPEEALHELHRVSRGWVLITVPHEPWFCLGNMLVLKNLSRLGNPVDHINHWTYSGFKKWICSKGGLSAKKCEFSRSFPWSIVKIQI